MPTKTNAPGYKTHIDSDNVTQTVKVKDNWTGTAIELLRALEETDDEIARLSIGEDLGTPKVTVFGQYGGDGEAGAVPEPLHKKLAEYGYHHVGEGGSASYKHTDETRSHVYLKDE